MSLDFSKINDKIVEATSIDRGYTLCPQNKLYIEKEETNINFRDFIVPFSDGAENYNTVYNRLFESLRLRCREINEPSLSAIIRSMDLIYENYL
ncbi:MAG: hypothetical protein AABX84_01965 [Nanoarchaeota archaeon]